MYYKAHPWRPSESICVCMCLCVSVCVLEKFMTRMMDGFNCDLLLPVVRHRAARPKWTSAHAHPRFYAILCVCERVRVCAC